MDKICSLRYDNIHFLYILICFTLLELYTEGACQSLTVKQKPKISGVIQLSAVDSEDTFTTLNYLQEETTQYKFRHFQKYFDNDEDTEQTTINDDPADNINGEDDSDDDTTEALEYRRHEYRNNYLSRFMTKRSGINMESFRDMFRVNTSELMAMPAKIWNTTFPVVRDEFEQLPPYAWERLQELWNYTYPRAVSTYNRLRYDVYPEWLNTLQQFNVLWERIRSEIPTIVDVGRKLLQTMRDDINRYRETIRKTFWDTIRYLRETWNTVYKTVKEFFLRIFIDFKFALDFEKKKGLIYDMHINAYRFIKSLRKELRETVKKFFQIGKDLAKIPYNRLNRLWNRLTKYAYGIWDSMSGRGPSLFSRITKLYQRINRKITKRIRQLTQFLMRYLRRAWTLLRNWINNKIKKISNRINRFYREILRIILRAWNIIRNKTTIWHKIRYLLRAMGFKIQYFKDLFATYRYRLRCRIRTYYRKFRTNIIYLYGRALYRLRNIFPDLYKLISEALRKLYLRWLDFIRPIKRILNAGIDVKKRFRTFLKGIVREIYKEFKKQFRFYKAMLKDIFKQLRNLIQYLGKYVTKKINGLTNLITFKVSLIRFIWNYIQDFVLTIAKALYQIARTIVRFLRKKFIDKWRYIFQGIYYLINLILKIFRYLKKIIHFPIDVIKWLIKKINWFKEWVKENIFRKPGLFYFIGDIMRAIRDRDSIFGWLRRKLEKNGLVKWLMQQYRTNVIAKTITNLLVDNFIKDWINWHLFRPTEPPSTDHRVSDLRPYFNLNTILNSIRLRGDRDYSKIVPHTPFDDKLAKAIGSYLNHLFGGSSRRRNPLCKLPIVDKIVKLDEALLNL